MAANKEKLIDINCNPPVIAVLGSGGGLRAMVGFLGTISKLAELNLLGTVTFISAISGSTWCMSSLYAKSNWSDFSYMKDLENLLCERIKLKTDRDWSKPWEKIKEKFLGDSYSLTDLWAYTFVFFVINKINEEKLSSHKEICNIGEDPYPIYSAVRMHKIHENRSEAWFEFTPHKSGFPAYDCYIKTEHLGCRFRGGRLLEELPEHDLIYLQGLWGSAPGADWVWMAIHELPLVPSIPAKGKCLMLFCTYVLGDIDDILFYFIIVLPEKSWSESIRGVYENAKVMKNIASCFVKWQWGTTNNFLYECKYKIPDGCDLFHKERIHLIDAGLEINTPYPLVLPPHRKVDLILSFDFSAGDPFETLKRTAEYCKAHQIPFPVNTEESYEYPPTKSCYVFEGDGHETPDVMHFPLFNTQTCGVNEKIETLSKKYATSVPSYETSMMNELLDMAKKNVESSMGEIHVKIQQCVWRSNKKT
ncbi:cytosolic phospholipase A2 gamma-like [Aquarana catesbeiana]|uniref:cytosolic phospholipase A2 gamma-like n=1 Tax=Aquarana catesbeiana TaxID=8400 RepID=UPI003CCA3384